MTKLYAKEPTVTLERGAPVLNTDQEGVVVSAPQAPWEIFLKRTLAVVVVACGSAIPFLSPTEDRLGFVLCSIVVATGAGLGITSSGNQPKR